MITRSKLIRAAGAAAVVAPMLSRAAFAADKPTKVSVAILYLCLLYTSDAADE